MQHDPGLLPPELALDEPPITEEELASEQPPSDRDLDGFDQVEWAFRRLARSQRHLDELADQFAEMVGRIEAWYEKECAPDRSTVAYLTGLIERYATARREREPKGPASFTFPSGTVKTTRTTEPAVVVEDEKALIAWLADDPKLAAATCRISLHPRITDVRERVAMREGTVISHDTGEVVPGLTIQEPGVRVTRVEVTTQEDDQ